MDQKEIRMQNYAEIVQTVEQRESLGEIENGRIGTVAPRTERECMQQ